MSDDTVKVAITAETAGIKAGGAESAEALTKVAQAAKGADAAVKGAATSFAAAGTAATGAAGETVALGAAFESIKGAGGGAAAAIEKVHAAVSHGHGATATATNEFRALFDEISSGRTTRTPGTLAIIANRVFGLQGASLAATGAVAGLGFALFEVVRSGERLNEVFGDIQAAMMATGRGADYSRGALTGIIETLRDIPGVSTKAAEDLVEIFARNREIGVGSYTALGQAAAGWARVTGDTVPKAGEVLSNALSEGYRGIEKLNDQYRFLTPTQLESIRQFEEMGERGRELDVVIGGLTDKIAPLATVGLTPLQKAANDAGVGWDHLMHALSESGPIADATEAIAGLLNALGRLLGYDPLSEQIDITNTKIKSLQASIAEFDGHPPVKLSATLWDAQAHLADLQAQLKATPTLAPGPSLTGARPNGDASGDDSDGEERARQRMQLFEGDLNQKLITEKAFGEKGKQVELDYWTGVLNQIKGSGGEAVRLRGEIAQKIYDLENEQADKSARGGGGGGSAPKEFNDSAWRAQLDEQLSAAKLFNEQAEAYELAFWQKKLTIAKAGGAEYTSAIQEIEERVYEIQAEQARQAAEAVKEAERQKAEAVRQAAEADKKAAEEHLQHWEKAIQPVSQAFSSSINGVIQGTENLRQAEAKAAQSILLSFINAEEQGLAKLVAINLAKLTSHTVTETARTGATVVGVAARTGAESAGAATGKALQASTAHVSILTDAKTAAAGAYSAVAQIPYVGPFLAPAAAGAAFAGVMAFDIASAEGGWDRVPMDGVMAELHKDEMVLPSHIAGPMRDYAINGPAAAVGRGDTSYGDVVNHFHGIGGGDVMDQLMKAVPHIARAVGDHWNKNPSARPKY